MDEKTLRNFSVATSIIGLLLLFVASRYAEPGSIRIKEITTEDVGLDVRACGVIGSIFTSKDGHVFASLNEDGTGDDSSIKVVIFSSTAKRIEQQVKISALKKGDALCVSGEISLYEGELEIIAREADVPPKEGA